MVTEERERESKSPILSKGFTLLELLVVIGIIAALSTLAIVALNTARAKARDTKRMHDLRTISKALDMYYADYGYYPGKRDSGLCFPTRYAWSSQGYRITDTCQPSPVYLSVLLQNYLLTLPGDPLNNGNAPYVCCSINYYVTSDGMQYDLITILETDHKDSCQYKNWISHTGGIGGFVPGLNESWCGSVFSGWPDSKRVYADH